MKFFHHSARRGRALARLVLGLAASVAALPAGAHQLHELEVSSPFSFAVFGAAIDVDGDYAAIGAPGFAGSVYVMERQGDTWVQGPRLRSYEAEVTNMSFGFDVARFGEWLAVGAPGDDEFGDGAGAVYIYRKREGDTAAFDMFQKIGSYVPESYGRFGQALDGNLTYLTVGEPGAGDRGRAEVFTFDGTSWNSAQRLNAHPNGNTFGFSIAMDGRRIAVGDPGYDDSSTGAGAVSVYDWDPGFGYWSVSHILESDYAEDLGRSVAMSAGALVSGSPSTRVGGVSRGSAVFFAVSLFNATETSVSYGTGAADGFGHSVDIGYAPDATFRAVIGIPFAGGGDQGSVRVLTYNTSVGWIPSATLNSTESAQSAWLGSAVCLDGYQVLSGAPQDEHQVGRGGKVRRFDISTGSWNELDELSAEALDYGDRFGSDVAVCGDIAVVGASRDDEMLLSAGAAYVFERQPDTSWRHTGSFFPPSGVTRRAAFGERVATDGERVLVSAPNQDDYAGRAYVYEKDAQGQWRFADELTPSLGESNGLFGRAIAIDGEMAVIGATQEFGTTLNSGVAYVFRRNSNGAWEETQRLVIPETDGSSSVGTAVALDFDGGELLVGVPGDQFVARFTWSGTQWEFALPILPGAGQPDNDFGYRISMTDGELAIATSGFDADSRTAHLYRKVAGGWGFREAVSDLFDLSTDIAYDGETLVANHDSQADVLQRFDQLWQRTSLAGIHDDQRDSRVDLSGSFAIHGARHAEDGAVSHSGRAWIVELDAPGPFLAYGFGDGSGNPCPCGNESEVGANEGCANTSGRGAKLRGEGSSSVSANDMVIVAEGLPSGRNGQLFVGSGRLFGAPFGDGQRLVASPSKRLAIRTADASGEARYAIQHGIGFWNPGDTRYFQILYRDFGAGICGSGFNTSSGLAVSFQP